MRFESQVSGVGATGTYSTVKASGASSDAAATENVFLPGDSSAGEVRTIEVRLQSTARGAQDVTSCTDMIAT